MLSRTNKLSRTSFPSYKDSRRVWAGTALRIEAYPGQQTPPPLFAVVVAKRLGKSAVLRHAFKRRVLEVVRGELKRFQDLPYEKYVVLPKGPLSSVTRASIVADIEQFLLQQQKR